MDFKIKVFASDDNLKELGEILSNESSRKIILALMEKEMYTNEISSKLGMRVSLVIHHLKKLEKLGLLDVKEKQIIRKGEKHRFFKINSCFFVIPDKTKDEIKNSGILKKIFSDGIKFASVIAAGFFTWFYDLFNMFEKNDVYPKPFIPYESDSLAYGLIIIIIGLIIERVHSEIKKRKK